MRTGCLLLLILIYGTGCRNAPEKGSRYESTQLHEILSSYWEERMQLFPLEATANGDYRYNDRMTITISESFRDSLKRFYTRYDAAVKEIDTGSLNQNDLLSYQLFRYETDMNLKGLAFPSHYLPVNQFWGLTLDLPLLGSGQGNQPFRTVKDYDGFLKRLSVLPAWTDTAIVNMRKGIAAGWVLPRTLVVKILPQLKAMLVRNAAQSTFYGAITHYPDSLGTTEKERLARAYTTAIDSLVIPSYRKLYDFMDGEYLAGCRPGSGISDIPHGNEYYQYLIRYWTTSDLTADSIYQLGLSEVSRISAEMNRVKNETGFRGDLHQFFGFLNKDRRFFPFRTPQQVLDSFWAIKKAEDPQLKRLFHRVPKSPFTVRQTEAFRAASASAEYNPPSEDGSRPGIFYVPIMNPATFNAVGMETLFLHEAIPGHHYQISLQQENKDLPAFRRFLWYGAYGEGWALYSESLGKELGVYTNPYQYFGHLSDAMHRAIRLVVDVGLHTKGMSREDAIDYMTAHERITRDEATAEIERYMAIPGQALSYKIGQLAIQALRKKYERQMGSGFRVADFHDQVLGGGCVPLNVLSANLEVWAGK